MTPQRDSKGRFVKKSTGIEPTDDPSKRIITAILIIGGILALLGLLYSHQINNAYADGYALGSKDAEAKTFDDAFNKGLEFGNNWTTKGCKGHWVSWYYYRTATVHACEKSDLYHHRVFDSRYNILDDYVAWDKYGVYGAGGGS